MFPLTFHCCQNKEKKNVYFSSDFGFFLFISNKSIFLSVFFGPGFASACEFHFLVKLIYVDFFFSKFQFSLGNIDIKHQKNDDRKVKYLRKNLSALMMMMMMMNIYVWIEQAKPRLKKTPIHQCYAWCWPDFYHVIFLISLLAWIELKMFSASCDIIVMMVILDRKKKEHLIKFTQFYNIHTEIGIEKKDRFGRRKKKKSFTEHQKVPHHSASMVCLLWTYGHV